MGKRKGLRRQSKTAAARQEAYRELRGRWWSDLVDHCLCFCWFCEGHEGLQVDHMNHGQAKSKDALLDLATWFSICPECHTDIPKVSAAWHPADSMNVSHATLTLMLAIKRLAQPEHYRRVHVLRMYGKAETYIQPHEIRICKLPEWCSKRLPCAQGDCRNYEKVMLLELRKSIDGPRDGWGGAFDGEPRRYCIRCRTYNKLRRGTYRKSKVF